MILRELFYFDEKTVDPVEDDQYEPEYDDSKVDIADTRKTRLSLKQINRVRKAAEVHSKEKIKELDLIRQMYGTAANAEAAGGMI